jgi:GTP cyclohydrolase I
MSTSIVNSQRDEPTQLDGEIVAAARRIFAYLSAPCEDESTRETPQRFIAALQELTVGTNLDPLRHLKTTFPLNTSSPGLIVARNVPFISVCEHHFLPFTGHATVAYLPSPGARVVGISKLARIVTEFAARPQMQERIGEQVVQALIDCLDLQGAACVLSASHACMTMRGARAAGASITTTHLRGVFTEDTSLQSTVNQMHDDA